MNWPQQLELFKQDVTGIARKITLTSTGYDPGTGRATRDPTLEPPAGRLVVADEGAEVYLDVYPAGLDRMRIKVTREALRIYAQKLLEAANR